MSPYQDPTPDRFVRPQLFTASAPLILIVDDDESARSVLVDVFQHQGYRVSRAMDGIEAVEKTRYLQPRVILMDLYLPRCSGWSATTHLKADPRTCHIPVVALTGDDRDQALRRAWDAGCAAFFGKPVNVDELVVCVRGLIASSVVGRVRPI
jgi:CheY-like chemotaxis protein